MFYFALNNKFKSAKLFSGKKNKFLIQRIIMTSVLFKKQERFSLQIILHYFLPKFYLFCKPQPIFGRLEN